MKQYLDLLQLVYSASPREDRTKVGTTGIFGHQMRFDLQKGFPLLTTKRLFLKGIIHELLWFLKGDTNIKYLKDNGVGIWDEWADESGDLGPVYGKQWRDWGKFKVFPSGEAWEVGKIDQIADLVRGLKETPFSRRHMVSAWNPAEVSSMALPPCHCLFQCYVRKVKGEYFLDLQLYQRSADVFLGVPFNIASYALLTMMLAQVCGMQAGEFIWTGGDTHLYANHREQADTQLFRQPYSLPIMQINPEIKDIFGFKYEDFNLAGYECHPTIKAEVAV